MEPKARSRASSTGLKGVYARLRGLRDARKRAYGSSVLLAEGQRVTARQRPR
jgi:hypothetical protein